MQILSRIWDKIRKKVQTAIGSHSLPPHHQGSMDELDLPTQQILEDIGRVTTGLYAKEAAARATKEAKDRKAARLWDFQKGNSRRAFARVKDNFKPPTFAVRDPGRGDQYTFDQRRIHELFKRDWDKVYRRHAQEAPDVDAFEQHYSDCIPTLPTIDGYILSPEDLQHQVGRMRQSAHGFDGWTVAALKRLTWELWRDRHEVEKVCFNAGRFPTAYRHAPNVMIPKASGDTPLHHRGITIFSLLHRILGGAYWSKLQPWQMKWAHPALHGAVKGGEILTDAWDLQAELEEASITGNGCVGVLLDYEKFFLIFSIQTSQSCSSPGLGSPRTSSANYPTCTRGSTAT